MAPLAGDRFTFLFTLSAEDWSTLTIWCRRRESVPIPSFSKGVERDGTPPRGGCGAAVLTASSWAIEAACACCVLGVFMLLCCPTATHCWSNVALVHPAGGARLISLEKPVHGYICNVYAVRAVAIWVGVLSLKWNQTYSFAAWGDGSKCLFKVGAQGTRVGLFLMVSLKCCSGYFSWENSCREPVGRVHSACTEMVRSMLDIGCLSGTWHSVWDKKKIRQRGNTISSLPQEHEDMGSWCLAPGCVERPVLEKCF